MNQALETVGCVTTHTFNNSPPGTKAAWLRASEGEKKVPAHMLVVIFQTQGQAKQYD